jgi:hypothetical protein
MIGRNTGSAAASSFAKFASSTVDRDTEGRRHPVLLWLVVVMLKHGFSHETIRQAILLHDHHLGRKISGDGHDPTAFTDMLLRKAAGLYSCCKMATTLLGSE